MLKNANICIMHEGYERAFHTYKMIVERYPDEIEKAEEVCT